VIKTETVEHQSDATCQPGNRQHYYAHHPLIGSSTSFPVRGTSARYAAARVAACADD
jgi:hypothetical protein